jgi:hypothetical protein
MSGSIQSPIEYIGTDDFNGGPGFAQARLQMDGPSDARIQIDGNGDGSVDMEIGLHNWTAPLALHNGNFFVI